MLARATADRESGSGLLGVALPRGLPGYPERNSDPVPGVTMPTRDLYSLTQPCLLRPHRGSARCR